MKPSVHDGTQHEDVVERGPRLGAIERYRMLEGMSNCSCIAAITLITFTACNHVLSIQIIPNRCSRPTAHDRLRSAYALGLSIASDLSILADDGEVVTRMGTNVAAKREVAVLCLRLEVGLTSLLVVSPKGFNWPNLEDNVTR